MQNGRTCPLYIHGHRLSPNQVTWKILTGCLKRVHYGPSKVHGNGLMPSQQLKRCRSVYQTKVCLMQWSFQSCCYVMEVTKLGAGCRKLERLYLDALEIAAGCFLPIWGVFPLQLGSAHGSGRSAKLDAKSTGQRGEPRIGNHWWRIVGRLGWLGYVGTNGNVIYIDLWYCHTLWQCGLFDLSGCYGEVICHVSKLCSGMGHLPNEESWCCDMWLLGRAGAAINCHCMTCHNMLQPVTKDNCAQGRFHFMDRLSVKS